MRLATGPSRRAKKPKPPPAYLPHDCAILTVDTARISGWAIYLGGRLFSYGEEDMLSERRGVAGIVARVLKYAEERGWSAVLVWEKPFAGTSQGQYVGAWKMAWIDGGGGKRRMLGVYPATWRARVLGTSRATRENARRAEMALARLIVGFVGGGDLGPDAAAAVCIGQWAIRAGEVAACLPKSTRKRRPKQASLVAE